MLGGVEKNRTHTGVEIELETQINLGTHLRAVGPADLRVSHRAEQNSICVSTGSQGIVRQRRPLFQVAVSPRGIVAESEN